MPDRRPVEFRYPECDRMSVAIPPAMTLLLLFGEPGNEAPVPRCLFHGLRRYYLRVADRSEDGAMRICQNNGR